MVRNFIVDCDGGVDDAFGLMIILAAHKNKQINIKAVTCVNGVTEMENAVKNVCRTLEAYDVSDIPVYRGATCSLLNDTNNKIYSKPPYGNDGFYDVFENDPDVKTGVRKANAAYAIYNIVSDNPGNIIIICTGPLTNIALAIKMYPDFVSKVKSFFMMGGNSTGQGNITSQAEFNFYCDPESAHIVLSSMNKTPLWLLPWETCLKCRITHEWRENVLANIDKPWIKMMNKVEGSHRKDSEKWHFYISSGGIIIAIALKPDMAKNVSLWHADLELHGYKTRGQVVLDHLQVNEPNVHLIEDFDSELFKKIILFGADSSEYPLDIK